MRRWLEKLNYTLGRWMYGRYGHDALSRFLVIASLVLAFLSCFPYLGVLYLLAFILIVFSLFRTFSKNHEKRRRELAAYTRISSKVSGWFSRRKRQWKERKTHRYFKCKTCKTVMRVPKGRGKIKISCPKCRAETIKKT